MPRTKGSKNKKPTIKSKRVKAVEELKAVERDPAPKRGRKRKEKIEDGLVVEIKEDESLKAKKASDSVLYGF